MKVKELISELSKLDQEQETEYTKPTKGKKIEVAEIVEEVVEVESEHRCTACNSNLQIANSKYETQTGTTDVYSVLQMVCVNPKCDNFSGKDLNNPLVVMETIKNKVN